MDEVPLTFDLLLTRTVNKTGASFIMVKTPSPMVIFKQITMPKEQLPKDIVVKVNKKGWMIESPGGFFHWKKTLLPESMRAHIPDSVKAAIKKTNSSCGVQHNICSHLTSV